MGLIGHTTFNNNLQQQATYIFIGQLNVENMTFSSGIFVGPQIAFICDSNLNCPVSLIWIQRNKWVNSPSHCHPCSRCSTIDGIHKRGPTINSDSHQRYKMKQYSVNKIKLPLYLSLWKKNGNLLVRCWEKKNTFSNPWQD